MSMRKEQIYPFGKVRSGDRVYDAYEMPFGNLYETLEAAAARLPEKIALIDANRKITYSALQRETEAMAAYLVNRAGVRRGVRVGIQMLNSIEFVVAFYAILKIGATVVSVNTKLAADEVIFVLRNSGATCLFMDGRWSDRDREVPAFTEVKHVISAGGSGLEGSVPFADALREGEGLPIPCTEREDSLPALLMYTSGTTGRPKGALMTHFNLLQGLYAYAVAGEMDDKEISLAAVPLFHITGLNCVLTLFIFLGAQLVLLPTFNAAEVLDKITEYKISYFHAVSTVYIMLESALLERHDLSSLRTALCGGGFVSRKTVERFCRAAKNCDFHPVYGMTETSGAGTYFPGHCISQTHIDSCGRTEANCSVKIVDAQNRELPSGVNGEICLKGAFVIAGYLGGRGDESITDGWLHSGDIGHLDGDGYLYIVDRIKDMINRGGEKVFSLPVEDAIMSYGKIKQAAVFAVSDSIYGEVPGAVIIPVRNEKIDIDGLTAYLREHLAHYKVPVYIEIRDKLPVTVNGKTKKYVLRQEFEKKYAR